MVQSNSLRRKCIVAEWYRGAAARGRWFRTVEDAAGAHCFRMKMRPRRPFLRDMVRKKMTKVTEFDKLIGLTTGFKNKVGTFYANQQW